MPGLSLIHPSSRSLILKIQLNSRNEFQQLLLGPPGPPVAWPRCNVLGNAISAIGALIVSIFYRGGDSIGTFRKCQNICTLPTWCVHLFPSFKFLLFLHKSHFSFQTHHFPACKSNTRIIKICPTEKMTKIHFYVDIWLVQPETWHPQCHSHSPLPSRDIGHILL